MSYSAQLTTIPDFTKLPSLKTLNLEYCTSLEELEISVGSLGRLVSLNLRGCSKLRSLPDTICNLRVLEVLNIGEWYNIGALPEELGNIKSLKELDEHDVAISELPDSIGCLSKLLKIILTCHEKSMILSRNPQLQTFTIFPDTICNLRELEVLNIGYSRSLAELPVGLGNIESLKELNVHDVIVSEIPDSIGRLSNLVKLRLTKNRNLGTLPKTIGYLRSLEILDISHCRSLKSKCIDSRNGETRILERALCIWSICFRITEFDWTPR